jgi:hypothetical protein
MPKSAEYVGAGLLTGLGQGLRDVGKMRYQNEKDAANEMREKSLLSFKSDLDKAAIGNIRKVRPKNKLKSGVMLKVVCSKVTMLMVNL